MSCGKSAINVTYILKISNHAQYKEVSILCPFLDPVGACGTKTGIDGIPHNDHIDNHLRGDKECETVAHNSRLYQVLYEVHQELFPDYHAHGEFVEKGCYILLE